MTTTQGAMLIEQMEEVLEEVRTAVREARIRNLKRLAPDIDEAVSRLILTLSTVEYPEIEFPVQPVIDFDDDDELY